MHERNRVWICLAALLLASTPLVATASPGAGSGQEGEQEQRIDPNTADERLLQEVPGIGPAMAQRIVEWRQEHGRFERLEDLLDIRGIGEKTLEKLRPYLEIREPDEDGEES